MKVKPLHDRVLVERIEQEEKTQGGIIIPETAKEKPMQGRVVAVGSGSRDDKGNLIPMEVKVDDIILFAKWGGTEVKIDNKEYLIMKESDVLAIMQ